MNFFKYEPVHEISNNMVCATNKASDQPAHTRSLIRAFASRLIRLHVHSAFNVNDCFILQWTDVSKALCKRVVA